MELASAPQVTRRARRINKRIIGLVFVLACTMGLCVLFSPERANHGLVVPEEYLNIGEVWEEEQSYEWTLTLRNPTRADVDIEGFLSSCNCVSIQPDALLIRAGQSADIHMRLALGIKQAEKPRVFVVKIIPQIRNEVHQQVGWEVHGRARRFLNIEPDTIDFGSSLLRGKPHPAKAAVISSMLPVEKLVAKCKPDSGRVEVIRTGAGSNSFEVRVIPKDTLPAGPFRFDVELKPIGEGVSSLIEAKLPVEGAIMEDVQILPESLYLGVIPVGQVVKQTVVLRSASNCQFEVEGMEVSAEDTRVEAIANKEMVGKLFRIQQRIAKKGKQERIVRFTLRMKDRKSATTVLHIRYVGLPVE